MVNRGASFADGKIIYNTLDDHTVAVDAQTGKMVWETQVGRHPLRRNRHDGAVVVKEHRCTWATAAANSASAAV